MESAPQSPFHGGPGARRSARYPVGVFLPGDNAAEGNSGKDADTVPPMPVNQRVVFLEALGLTLRETYPGVSCRVARFRAALPPVLGVYFGDARREIGCDLAHDGWNFVWGFDPRRVIGPAGDLSRAAAAIAADLGAHPRPGH